MVSTGLHSFCGWVWELSGAANLISLMIGIFGLIVPNCEGCGGNLRAVNHLPFYGDVSFSSAVSGNFSDRLGPHRFFPQLCSAQYIFDVTGYGWVKIRQLREVVDSRWTAN